MNKKNCTSNMISVYENIIRTFPCSMDIIEIPVGGIRIYRKLNYKND